MTPSIATWRPWYHRFFEALRRTLRFAPAAPRATPLHELDTRTLHDIGIDASEIASIEAESRGQARLTRRRIVAVR